MMQLASTIRRTAATATPIQVSTHSLPQSQFVQSNTLLFLPTPAPLSIPNRLFTTSTSTPINITRHHTNPRIVHLTPRSLTPSARMGQTMLNSTTPQKASLQLTPHQHSHYSSISAQQQQQQPHHPGQQSFLETQFVQNPTLDTTQEQSTSTKLLRYSYMWLLGSVVFFSWRLSENMLDSQRETIKLRQDLNKTHALLLELQSQQSSHPNTHPNLSPSSISTPSLLSPAPVINQQSSRGLNQYGTEHRIQLNQQQPRQIFDSYGQYNPINPNSNIQHQRQINQAGLTTQMSNPFSTGQLHDHFQQISAIHSLTHLPHYHDTPHSSSGITIYPPQYQQQHQQQQQQQQEQLQSQFTPSNSHQILIPPPTPTPVPQPSTKPPTQ